MNPEKHTTILAELDAMHADKLAALLEEQNNEKPNECQPLKAK